MMADVLFIDRCSARAIRGSHYNTDSDYSNENQLHNIFIKVSRKGICLCPFVTHTYNSQPSNPPIFGYVEWVILMAYNPKQANASKRQYDKERSIFTLRFKMRYSFFSNM